VIPQTIHGEPRGVWVVRAAKAMQATTDPALLYRIVRIEGFPKFRRLARKEFKREAGIRFTDTELQAIFDHLDLYIYLEERKFRSFAS
jgi:hypothetical protein